MPKQELTPLQTELLNRADSIFAAIKDSVNSTKDFVVEQLPDVVHQLILLERASLSLKMFFFVSILSISIRGFYLCIKHDYFSSRTEFHQMIIVFGGIAGTLTGVIGIITHFRDFLTVWFAPKIYLIEYIVRLGKSVL
jgi:hypothetical protein